VTTRRIKGRKNICHIWHMGIEEVTFHSAVAIIEKEEYLKFKGLLLSCHLLTNIVICGRMPKVRHFPGYASFR